jgi:hypothetical protein
MLFPMRAEIRSLERQIARIKRELSQVGDLRIGTLSRQENVCGKPNCRWKASPPRKHGPYYQLSYTRKGKSGTETVRREHLSQIMQQLRNYAKLRDLVDRWIDLATKLSRLKTKPPP